MTNGRSILKDKIDNIGRSNWPVKVVGHMGQSNWSLNGPISRPNLSAKLNVLVDQSNWAVKLYGQYLKMKFDCEIGRPNWTVRLTSQTVKVDGQICRLNRTVRLISQIERPNWEVKFGQSNLGSQIGRSKWTVKLVGRNGWSSSSYDSNYEQFPGKRSTIFFEIMKSKKKYFSNLSNTFKIRFVPFHFCFWFFSNNWRREYFHLYLLNVMRQIWMVCAEPIHWKYIFYYELHQSVKWGASKDLYELTLYMIFAISNWMIMRNFEISRNSAYPKTQGLPDDRCLSIAPCGIWTTWPSGSRTPLCRFGIFTYRADQVYDSIFLYFRLWQSRL